MRAIVVAVLFSSACSLVGGLKTSTSSSSPSPENTPSSSREMPVRAGEGEYHREKDFLEMEEIESLRGLPVEQAKARAKQLGHKGPIKVDQLDEFREGCKPNIVCSALNERGSTAGIPLTDPLILYTNKTLEIAPPPE